MAARADHVSDDMAACMFRVSDGPSAVDSPPRVEELELLGDDPVASVLEPFLSACGLDAADIAGRIADAELTVSATGGAVVTVRFPADGPGVAIEPANVESIAAAHAVRAAV